MVQTMGVLLYKRVGPEMETGIGLLAAAEISEAMAGLQEPRTMMTAVIKTTTINGLTFLNIFAPPLFF